MCNVVYFRNPSSKNDVLCAVNMLNVQGVDSSLWGFFTSFGGDFIRNFLNVKLDVEISSGMYLYVWYDNEPEALAIAAKVYGGSLVLPDVDDKDYCFVMRVN